MAVNPLPFLFRDEHTYGNVALHASLLGLFAGIGGASAVAFAVQGSLAWTCYSLYITALALFHILEYMFIAVYSPHSLSFSSFVFDNEGYREAILASFVEFIIEDRFLGSLRPNLFCLVVGAAMIIIGETVRLAAIREAGQSFTHLVAYEKREEHRLVVSGIYSYVRHPSYFGYYVWCIGTQVLIFNPVCFVLYNIVLFRFFYNRVRREEQLLESFFGQKYVKYKSTVWSGVIGIR